MEIRRILENKEAFLPLLLLGDEQASMIARYLDRSALYALYDGGVPAAVCAVADEDGVLEIKNLAVAPDRQRQGLGRAMVEFVAREYPGKQLRAGTGDSPLTLPFYASCGFREVSRIPGFFTDHYDHPIFEGGRQLVDMVVLERPARRQA